MFRHLGWNEVADRIERGIEGAIKKKTVTYDLSDRWKVQPSQVFRVRSGDHRKHVNQNWWMGADGAPSSPEVVN